MSGRPVTPRQLAVLRWVADGCRPGAWPDDTHKLSARALEARGLIAVSRRNGTWNAVLRPAGQHYLDHGEYPARPAAAVNSRRVAAEQPQPGRASTPAAPPAAESQVPGQLPAVPPAESLISRIRAAGGRLAVDTATYQECTRLDAQIRAIRRFGKLPSGLQLLTEQPSWKSRVLTITPLPEWMTAGPSPVPVPDQLRAPHAAITALRDSDRLPVTGPPRSRALRLCQALAAAADDRGYAVTFPRPRADGRDHRHRDLGHLRFTVRGHDISVRVTQLKDRSRHVPTARELADQQRYSWIRIPEYDYAPSGRLRIELPGLHEYQQSAWADGVKSRLEDKLPEIFRELEYRADAAHRQQLAVEQRRREEEAEQQRLIARATSMLTQAHRAEILNAQLASWQRARQLDGYLTAMDAQIMQIEDPDAAAAARQWQAWARAHAAALDPLNGELAMPPDPEPTHGALAPFLERHRSF